MARTAETEKLDALKHASAVTDAGLFRTPFFEPYDINDNSQSVEICLDIAGIEPVQFYDDAGPKTFTGQTTADQATTARHILPPRYPRLPRRAEESQ
jgi:hypothetical protein